MHNQEPVSNMFKSNLGCNKHTKIALFDLEMHVTNIKFKDFVLHVARCIPGDSQNILKKQIKKSGSICTFQNLAETE